jgi:hypothetical protein
VTADSDRRALAGRVAAKAISHLLVVVAMPTICFVLGHHWWGLTGGVVLAMTWNSAWTAVRWCRGEPFSAVLLLSVAELTVKAALGLALHSARAYFIAPAVMTGGLGMVYIASAFTGTPLVFRLIEEFLPQGSISADDPPVAQLLRKATVFYGVEQIVSAAVSVVMVLNLSTVMYATVHPIGSWAVLGLAILGSLPWLRRDIPAATRSLKSRYQALTDTRSGSDTERLLALPA